MRRQAATAQEGVPRRRIGPFAYRRRMRRVLAVLLLPMLLAACGRGDGQRAAAALPAGAAGAAPGRHGDPRNPRQPGDARPHRRADRLRGARAGRRRTGCISSPAALAAATFERDRLDLVAVETDEGRARRGAAPLPQALLACRSRPGASVAPAAAGATCREFPATVAYALQQLVNAMALAADLCVARDRLLADLRAGRADQSGVRRDRGARRLRRDRRRRGGGRARRRRRRSSGSRSPSCWRRAISAGMEHADRPHRHRAAARAPPARPADPDRDRRGGATDRRSSCASRKGRANAGCRRCSTSRSRSRAPSDFIVTVTPMQIVVALRSGLRPQAACCCCSARTRFGRAWRAFADDPGTAALFGVDGKRLLAIDISAGGPARRPRRLDRRGLLRQHLASRSARCSA